MSQSESSLPKEPHPAAALLREKADAKAGLKGVSVQERYSLPNAETIAQEKREVELRKSIEDDEKRSSLLHVATSEKVVLPSKEGTRTLPIASPYSAALRLKFSPFATSIFAT